MYIELHFKQIVLELRFVVRIYQNLILIFEQILRIDSHASARLLVACSLRVEQKLLELELSELESELLELMLELLELELLELEILLLELKLLESELEFLW